MKKILIIGVSSFIGSNLALYLRKSYRVIGTYLNHKPYIDDVPCFRFSIKPDCSFEELIDTVKPDSLIYTAGTARETQCQSDPAHTQYVNADAPSILGRLMENTEGLFIYFSSSKVFSGNEGDYSEDDHPSPQTIYGKTKQTAEQLLHHQENKVILRLGTLFGMGTYHYNSIFNRILYQLRTQNRTPFISDEFRSFYHVEDLVKAVALLLERKSGLDGIFHFSNSQRHSYYSLASTIAEVFGISKNRAVPTSRAQFDSQTQVQTHRSRDLTLDGSLFSQKFSFPVSPIEKSLEKIRERLKLGKQ